MAETTSILSCSFCNKSQREVKKLVAGANAHICNECVPICVTLIEEPAPAGNRVPRRTTLDEILAHLHSSVAGQEKAASTLAAVVFNQYLRASALPLSDTSSQATAQRNCVITGPPGSGKTAIAKAIAGAVDLPFASIDAMAFNETRYARFEDPVELLVQRAAAIQTTCTSGILFVDNAHLLERRAQQALLPLLSGYVAIPKKAVQDTRNVLLIFAGQFSGIERKLGRNEMTLLDPKLLIEEGFLPELASSFGIVCRFEPPTAEDLRAMLLMPGHGIFASYNALFAAEGVQMCLTEEAIAAIVEEASRRGTAAKALRGIMENISIAISSRMTKERAHRFEIDLPLVSRIIGRSEKP